MIISISTRFNGTVSIVLNIHRQTGELPFLRWLSSTFLFLNTIRLQPMKMQRCSAPEKKKHVPLP